MRLLMLVTCLVFGLAGSLGEQPDEGDPYSMNTVRFELQMRSGGKRVIHSWTQKQLARLGDGVSIAVLKLLDEPDLANPQTVKDFLPIIRDSFAQPQLIATEVDKKPKITLFLLNYLQQKVSEKQARQDIQQTIDFVKQKTTE